MTGGFVRVAPVHAAAVHMWMLRYELAFLEATDAEPMVARAAAEEAFFENFADYRLDLSKWPDPEEAVRDEIACWEPG